MSMDTPTPEYARNMRLLGHSDMGGRPDGQQVMVNEGYAYVGHMFSQGLSVIDVRDPREPKPVGYVPCPDGTWSLHLQSAEGLLLVANAQDLGRVKTLEDDRQYYSGSMRSRLAGESGRGYAAGVRIYETSDPAAPREIGFAAIDGVGVHRVWYIGGRWAYVSAMPDGWSDFIFMTLDVSDPTKPEYAGAFWLPGMHAAGGEVPTWGERRYSCHHGIVSGDTAYVTWRDGGVTILDVTDRGRPTLVSHRTWCPPFGGGTHNALPLADRELMVVVDEAVLERREDGVKHIWTFDIRAPENPVSISTFPIPDEADYVSRGGRFGPHNVHENRPGSLVSSTTIVGTYNNAGVRVYDLSNPYRPEEVAALVPQIPERMVDERPGRTRALTIVDAFADAEGLVYASDQNGGLFTMERL
jgi:hypothetical protein